MTTELVILLCLFVYIVLGIAKGPENTFKEAGPRLGARLEKHIETGPGFTYSPNLRSFQWLPAKGGGAQ